MTIKGDGTKNDGRVSVTNLQKAITSPWERVGKVGAVMGCRLNALKLTLLRQKLLAIRGFIL